MVCGKEFEVKNYKYKQLTCSKECLRKYRSMKGSGYLNSKGYKCIHVDGHRYAEHVYLMECKIGRKLRKNECVHHIDHNPQNNNIDNLQLMTKSEHSRLHRQYEIQHYGKVKSNMAGWNKGKKLKSSWNSKKVFWEEGMKTFDSARKCALEVGLSISSVLKVCKGIQKQSKGNHFRFCEEL